MKKTLFAGVVLSCLATTTLAQSQCAPHADVMARLATGYGETRQAIALAANGTIMEIYANLDSRTWTITVTTAGGPTCLVAAGHEYQPVVEELPNNDMGG